MAAFATALVLANPAAAVSPVVVVDAAGTVHTLGDAELAAFAQTSSTVVFSTRNGTERGDYTGVLLWRVIEMLGVPAERRLTRTIVVTGRDGYAVAFSLGELDPEYGNEPALVAVARDGTPVDDAEGPRLIVPGDKRGSRAVKDVVRIEVR